MRIASSASPERRLPRLAPPPVSSPRPVASRASIAAQSSGAEHATSRPVSFSTQRKAGMSSLEPSRIPAWLAPVCDERSGSHSTSREVAVVEPARHRRRAPAAIARRSTGSREPVDLAGTGCPGRRRARGRPGAGPRGAGPRTTGPGRRPPRSVLTTVEAAAMRIVASSAAAKDETCTSSGKTPAAATQHRGVEQEDEHEAEREGVRQAQRGDDRRQEGVQHGHDEHDEERRAGRLEPDARAIQAPSSTAATDTSSATTALPIVSGEAGRPPTARRVPASSVIGPSSSSPAPTRIP